MKQGFLFHNISTLSAKRCYQDMMFWFLGGSSKLQLFSPWNVNKIMRLWLNYSIKNDSKFSYITSRYDLLYTHAKNAYQTPDFLLPTLRSNWDALCNLINLPVRFKPLTIGQSNGAVWRHKNLVSHTHVLVQYT